MSSSIRTVIMRVIDVHAVEATGRTGIDKELWRGLVVDDLRCNDPSVLAELTASAVDKQVSTFIEEYIRATRNPSVDAIRQLDEIKRRVKEEQRIVQVLSDDGRMAAKPFITCTAAECRRLAQYYAERRSTFAMRESFYLAVAQQLELGGFATVGDLLAA